jgi:hypothetical protein
MRPEAHSDGEVERGKRKSAISIFLKNSNFFNVYIGIPDIRRNY